MLHGEASAGRRPLSVSMRPPDPLPGAKRLTSVSHVYPAAMQSERHWNCLPFVAGEPRLRGGTQPLSSGQQGTQGRMTFQNRSAKTPLSRLLTPAPPPPPPTSPSPHPPTHTRRKDPPKRKNSQEGQLLGKPSRVQRPVR